MIPGNVCDIKEKLYFHHQPSQNGKNEEVNTGINIGIHSYKWERKKGYTYIVHWDVLYYTRWEFF